MASKVERRERAEGRQKRSRDDLDPFDRRRFGNFEVLEWWRSKEEDAHQHVIRVARDLHASGRGRQAKLREWERLYKSRMTFPMSRAPASTPLMSRQLTLNGVRSCVNTACAKIGKSKPKPQFLTVDGDWSLQEKAKDLTAFLEGLFDETRIYDAEENVFRDACTYDVGIMHMAYALRRVGGKPTKRICVERVPPDELLVSEAEGYYGAPRMMLRRRMIDRGQLGAMFAKGGLHGDRYSGKEQKEVLDAIMRAPQGRLDLPDRLDHNSMVEIIEAWHLPSSPVDRDASDKDEPTDGRYAMVVEGRTLIWDEYRKDSLPFVFMYWERPVIGFFGTGLAEELSGIQYELNEALKRVQIAQRHACAPKVLVPEGAKIAKGKMGNDLRVEIVNYAGAIPPTFLTPNAMPTEVYQWIENLWHKMFETTGISQMTAASHKPAGLDSGAALREFEDIESERFVLVGQRREQFFMDCAKLLIDMSRDLYAQDKDLAVTGSAASRTRDAGRLVRRIKWSEVDLAEDQYTMRAFPVSLLPSTPAGKLQKVTELMQNGLIDRDQGLELLDFPDVEKFTSLATAALEDAQMVVDAMVNGGEYIPPEPFMDLALSKRLAVSTYLKGKTRGATESALDNLRRFIGECDALMDLAMAQSQAQQQPPAPVGAPSAQIPIQPQPGTQGMPAAA
jgi:hypothetical protein